MPCFWEGKRGGDGHRVWVRIPGSGEGPFPSPPGSPAALSTLVYSTSLLPAFANSVAVNSITKKSAPERLAISEGVMRPIL